MPPRSTCFEDGVCVCACRKSLSCRPGLEALYASNPELRDVGISGLFVYCFFVIGIKLPPQKNPCSGLPEKGEHPEWLHMAVLGCSCSCRVVLGGVGQRAA